MTPIELRRSSDLAIAMLQAMRDAAAVVDGVTVPAYEGPEPARYRQIFDEWLADLRAPAIAPLSMPAIGFGGTILCTVGH